jgi:spore coat protein CotH
MFFPDRCVCESGWTGYDCSLPQPNLYSAPYGELFSQSVYLNDSYGDNHPLFNLSHVARLYISVDDGDLAYLLSPSNMWNQTWVESVFAYENGLKDVALGDVYIMLNEGYNGRRSIKKDWTLDFAYVDPTQSLLGVQSVVLKGAESGDGILREQLYMDMLRAASVPAQRTSFAQVWINEIYQGLYLVEEQIDDAFAISRFNDIDGDLYRMNGPVYLSYPSSDYT